MKVYYVAALLALSSLPALGQVAPLAPREVRVQQPDQLASARAYVAWADSTITAAGVYITDLKRENDVLAQTVQNREAEVQRQRQVNAQLQADNSQLNDRLLKAVNLPVEKPLLLDPHTAIGALGGAFLAIIGIIAAKH